MDVYRWMEKSISAMEAMAPATVDWLPWSMTKSEWAAWAQAFFSVVTIVAVILIARSERNAEKIKSQRDEFFRKLNELESKRHLLIATHIAILDARKGLYNLRNKISGKVNRPPKSSLPRILGLQRVFETLLTKDIPSEAVSQVLIVLCELSYSIRAIHERPVVDGESIIRRANKAEVRRKKVSDAADALEIEINNLEEAISRLRSSEEGRALRRKGLYLHLGFRL